MNALKLAEQLKCQKFIFSGSQAEYGKAKLEFSKLSQEFCVRAAISYIHLRIFSVYGIGDREGTLVDSCIKKFNSGGGLLLGSCQQKWNYLYIDDFVFMILKVIESGNAEGIYNVASQDTRLLSSFVKEIYELSNKQGTYRFAEMTANPEGSPSLNPNTARVMSLIGEYEMKSFAMGIKEIMRMQNTEFLL